MNDDDQTDDDGQQRDKLLLRLLKTPPQPRPKRERGGEDKRTELAKARSSAKNAPRKKR
jgi:hypothetical protein